MIKRTFLIVASACYLLQECIVAQVTIKIMPLGDELTVGSDQSPGGYRLQLYLNLDDEGYGVDLLGTNSSNPAEALPHPNHEGHIGWSIQDMTARIEEFLDKAEPDVILLLIGAKDVVESKNMDEIVQSSKQWDTLILKITHLRPHVHIIASNLLDRKNKSYEEKAGIFNRIIKTAASSHKKLGRNVHFIDMNSIVTRDLLRGKVHPGKAGYRKIGNKWASKIKQIYGKNGDKSSPKILKVMGSLDRSEVNITFTKPIHDDSVVMENFKINRALTILSARIEDDKRSIILKTEKQIPGSAYKVTIKGGVKDRKQHPNRLRKQLVRKFRVGWRFLVFSDFHLGKLEPFLDFYFADGQ